ncbi:MAG TPA: hypothetical protein VMR41_00325 [Patescibacteria group bacterium]|nr:hypothetical protein [Patescibacteria group bacterium]
MTKVRKGFMGKIRVKTLGDAEQEKKQKAEAKKRAEAKRVEEKKNENTLSSRDHEVAKQSGRHSEFISESSQILKPFGLAQGGQVQDDNELGMTEKTKPASAKASNSAKASLDKTDGRSKKSKFAKKQTRSSGYQNVAQTVDQKKVYSANEALALLPKLKRAKFDETVELHITTIEPGVAVSTVLPNGTGKKVKVAIADEALIAQIEKGQINFDILIAEPMMMPKLAKVARILGPRGLMPNPKNGTVTNKPAEAAKKFEGGQVNYKTEAKFPIMHMSIGKISFGEQKLNENLKAIAQAMPEGKVKNANLKLTMSPAIKIDYTSI